MSKGGGVPKPSRAVVRGAAMILGGVFSLSVASSVAIRTLTAISEAKQKKIALPCGICKGKGFYICKLCKGNSTIKWSPMFDPVHIHPCLCPTCDGNMVQRCLNCLGKGYSLHLRGWPSFAQYIFSNTLLWLWEWKFAVVIMILVVCLISFSFIIEAGAAIYLSPTFVESRNTDFGTRSNFSAFTQIV